MNEIIELKQNQIRIPKDFRKLDVYNRARDLRINIYQVAEGLPNFEQYNIALKMRKCATGIPSNMAEGQYVGYINKEINHFDIVIGKCGELRSLLELCRDSGYIDEMLYDRLDRETHEISKICVKLKSNLYSKLNEAA